MDSGQAGPVSEPSGSADDPSETACDSGAAIDAGTAAGMGTAAGTGAVTDAGAAAGTGAVTDAGAVTRPTSCRAREVLQRVGDKWSMYVIDLLGQGTMRFTELHRAIDGITARMLTVTLRGLERDGIVTRTIHPVIPPRVEYALTPMGRTLLDTIGKLVTWADSHLPEIEGARAAYDARHPSQ